MVKGPLNPNITSLGEKKCDRYIENDLLMYMENNIFKNPHKPGKN